MTTYWQNNLPQAILFDNDGVLIASEALHWAAWERLLAELGIPFNSTEMSEFIGKTAPQVLTELLNRHLPNWDKSQFNIEALALKKSDFYSESIRNELRTYPGVADGLAWLRGRGIRLGVVTNATRKVMEASLTRTGIIAFFDVMISRNETPTPKPDPAPYALAAQRLGIAPEQCLAVEDSVPGMTAALMAGMPTAGILTNFPARTMERPIPQRPDLKPLWLGQAPAEFFSWIQSLQTDNLRRG